MSRVDHGVYALQYARRTASTRGEHFYGHDADCGGPYPIDYFVWAICRPDDVVFVDGGFTREVAAQRGNRDYLADPVNLLGLLGRGPDEVSHLVLSHLHYDHTGHVDAFPNATIHLQQRELDFWTGPLAHRGVHSHLHESSDVAAVTRLAAEGRVTIHDGDAVIDSGVSLHLVGGHTAGLQVVAVYTIDGPVVLASDATHFYENIEHDKPYAIVTDLPAMYTAFDRLRELAGDDGVVVPGHDPRIRDRHPTMIGTGGLVTILSESSCR
ncbi:MAG: N-acyl homoserine lactonase family protein [Acidimicrobiales bacterium]